MSGTSNKLGIGLFLCAAWVTPAVIAGVLGWSAIWGNGSAFVDYLFPLPLIGGVLHLPSFLLLSLIVIAANTNTKIFKGAPAVALACALVSLTLQLDVDHISELLFTDLESKRPIKFGRNPLLLFIGCDATFLWLWLLLKSVRTPPRLWLIAPLAPMLAIALQAFSYLWAPAQFETAAPGGTTVPGHEIQLVYTNIGYDEGAFRAWIDSRSSFSPWRTPNAQHKAVHFVTSRQKVAYLDYSNLDSDVTIGTFCLYEEDKSTVAHPGFFDCFSERPTLTDRLNAALTRQPGNVNINFARWHASLQVCEGLSLQKQRADSIEHIDHCLRMRRQYPQDLLRTKKEYGRRSREARLAAATGKRLGFDSK